jgi:hypothetical protein
MQLIGMLGLRSVLEHLGRWEEGLRLDAARHRLFAWDAVRDQLTRIEALCKQHGIVLVYNPKAHPFFNPIEVQISSIAPF